MKKEVGLALLGVSIALGSPAVSYGMADNNQAAADPQDLPQLALLTAPDVTLIRQCVAEADVLCLRALLAERPELLQCAVPPFDPALSPWEIALCQALLNFWIASEQADGRDLWAEVLAALSSTAAIYA